jgi:diamine N-acetyltransferase
VTVTGGVVLRLGTTADVGKIIDWERHPANAPFIVVWPEARHLEALEDPGYRHLVIESGGRPVGFVLLAGLGEPQAEVELLRIVVADKERGVGQAAVAAALRVAFEELAAARVWLDVAEGNARAAHVYEKCGFRIDAAAELWATIAGERTRLMKMVVTREEWMQGASAVEPRSRP